MSEPKPAKQHASGCGGAAGSFEIYLAWSDLTLMVRSDETAGPRLNELAAKKREIACKLALRPDDAPKFLADNGAESDQKQVEGLRLRSLEGSDQQRKATQLVRGLVRCAVVLPREEDEPQGFEFEAGFPPVQVSAERYWTGGCGGWI